MSMKNIWEVCNSVESYKSTNSNGIDWTDPKNSAWTNFSWFDSSTTEQQRTYVKNRWNHYTKQGDAGKLIFFDLINLAPTTGENYGYHSTNLPMSTKGYFFTGLDSNGFKNVKYISTGRFKRLLSHEQNETGHQSESDFQKIIKNGSKIDEDSMKHPAESEFKLPWMRNLVEAGVEGQMGPFIQDGKLKDGRQQFKIDKSVLDMFYKNHNNYKEAIWQAWLKEESNTDRQSIFAKISKTDLNNLRNNKPLDSSGEEDFVLTEVANGKLTSSTNTESIFQKLALGSDKKTPITVRGVMPKITKTSKENFVVSGWIRLPEIYGNRQLPWPFVWKYIVRGGIWQKSEWKSGQTYMGENVSVVYKTDILSEKSNSKNSKYFIPYGTGKKGPSATYLAYDARARFWHHRYSSNEVPDRELFFWLRYLNGAAGSVGERYVAQAQPPTIRLFPETKLEESWIIQCGGVPESGVVANGRPDRNGASAYPPYRGEGITTLGPMRKLRSKYVSQIHDTVGWSRYNTDGSDYSLPDESKQDLGTPLNGESTQIVDHTFTSKKGYYSFTGGTSDRSAIQIGKFDFTDDYNLYDYKSSFKLDVQKNHIPLHPLFVIEKNDQTGIIGSNDRFVSSDSVLSNSATQTIYHNHSNSYSLNFNDAFNPGTLTSKEIQFLYELVSFVFYGKVKERDMVATGRGAKGEGIEYVTRTIFDENYINNNFYFHRWKELEVINSMLYRQSPSSLMDYISWAAPTNEQFFKQKYSELSDYDTFIHRYKTMLSTSGQNWVNTQFYPVHNFAKRIYESENSTRPLVPVWVHYKYISRLSNTGEYGLGVDINDSEVFRVFGGKNNDDIEQGKLIALPMFVLGGRPDIPGGDKDSWDSTWGETKPFSIENGVLKVNELDEILDAWAQGKLHNGKYVSAMEIAFWIRYRHGFASAPTQKTIKWNVNKDIKEIINYKNIEKNSSYWPKEAFVHVESSNSRVSFGRIEGGDIKLNDGDVLSTETLHNIPILTSYYSPICVGYGDDTSIIDQNADPLIDMPTESKIKNNPKTAFTGWNSKYVAHWSGAKNIPADSLQKTSIFQSISSLFSLSYPGNITTINLSHVKPFKRVFDTYLAREKTFKYDSKYGLKFGFSSDKQIKTSDIQAWFRAERIIKIHDRYAKYVEDGLNKQPGEKGSVIPVIGEVYDDKTEKSSSNVIFISGETFGHKDTNGKHYTGDEDFTEENLLVKPWYNAFTSTGIPQPELESMLDDYYLGTKQCLPQYRYMRHLIQAVDFMYFSPKTGGYGWHSEKQAIDTLKYVIKMMYLKSSIVGYQFGTDVATLRTFVLSALSSGKAIKLPVADIQKAVSALSETNKFITNVGKFGKVIWTTTGLYTKVITLGGISGEATSGIFQKEIFDSANKFEKIIKNKIDMPLFWLKLASKWAASKNLSDFNRNTIYIGKELTQKFGGDYVKDNLVKYPIQKEIERLVLELGEDVALPRALRIARIGSAATLGLTLLFELISWQVDLAIENDKQEEKIEKMWKLLNDASKAGYVEGPYMESKGAIRIKKGTDGTIEGNYSIDAQGNVKTEQGTPSQSVTGDGFWEGPVPGYDQPQEPQTQDTLLNQYIKKHNDKFYKPGGLADKIGANLKANSCECRFLVDLFADTSEFKSDSNFKYPDKGSPYARKNWQEGPFRRQWRQRDGIINSAPNYSDIPITFRKNPSPNIDIEYYPFERESRQISYLQTPADWITLKGNIRKNIRANGQNGTQVDNMNGCPRFWWPNILHISPSDDLCSYMAIDGKYPSKNPETYKLCDGFSEYQLRNNLKNEKNKNNLNSDVRKYARSTFIPSSPISYKDVTDGDLNIDSNSLNKWDVENKVQLGNTIFSLQGVDGIAPPHEREIVRLFRMKYGIEIVNPKNNCCSIGEVLDEEPLEQSKRELSSKQRQANNCQYIIDLNTKRFREIVKNSCKANTQNDNSEEVIEDERSSDPVGIRMADISEIDNYILSGSLQTFDVITIGGWDDNRRRRKSRRKRPCIPPMLCDDNEIPIPPDVVTGPRPPAIEEEDKKEHPHIEADLNRGARVGSGIGKVVGQGVGGIVGYLAPESRVPIKKFTIVTKSANPLKPGSVEYLREDLITNIWTGEQRSEFNIIGRLEYEQTNTGWELKTKDEWKQYMESNKKTK